MQISSQYKVKALELNFEQWKEVMARLEVTPDKPKREDYRRIEMIIKILAEKQTQGIHTIAIGVSRGREGQAISGTCILKKSKGLAYDKSH